MRTIPAGLQTSLDSNAAKLCLLVTITRTDGQIVRLTDSDTDLAYASNLYLAAASIEQTNLEGSAALASDNAELAALIDSTALDGEDLRIGKFDYAEFELSVIDRDNLAGTHVVLMRGRLGEVRLHRGLFTAELRGMANRLRRRLVENYSPTCRADLGDSRCTVAVIPPLVQRNTAYAVGTRLRHVVAPSFTDSRQYGDRTYRVTVAGTTAGTAPTYSTTVGVTTTDGTAQLICEQAQARAGEVATVLDGRSFTTTGITGFTTGHFALGHVQWETGDNIGLVFDIKSFTFSTPNGTWVLFDKTPYPIQAGDRFVATPGCDKRVDTCRTKFDNVVNFRGEPYVPTADYLASYPRRT